MNRREFAKGLGAVLVVSQVAARRRLRRRPAAPRRRFTTWTATMAALADTCPPDPGATSLMRCAPFRSGRSRSISSRPPGTIYGAKIRRPIASSVACWKTARSNARVEMVNGTFSQPFGWAQGGESNIRQLLRGRDIIHEHFPNAVIETYAVQEPCWASCLPQLLRSLGFNAAVLEESRHGVGRIFRGL